MSHVDDGTLHAYLDGELSPPEARGVEAHLAQCPACRGRLDEERALITRAGELLAVAAPPDRALPPFRAGDVKPLTRLWWRVRLPLAWAATVLLALGIGTYLGSGFEQVPQPQKASDAQPAAPRALDTSVNAERAGRESLNTLRVAARTPPAAQPAVRAQGERKREAPSMQSAATPAPTPAPPPAPQAGAVIFEDGLALPSRSPISADSARALLGADPFAVPGAPIRTIYRARETGYPAVVIVEQALDSSTVIEVVNRRRSSAALDAVAVTGAAAPATRADSPSVPERAPLERARIPDSLAATPAAKVAARLEREGTRNRERRLLGNLEVRVSGPLPSDSLQKLLRVVQPMKP